MTNPVIETPTARAEHRHEAVDAMLERVRRVEARRERRHHHRNGRAAGVLLVAVWASAVVSSPFLDNVPDPGAYLLPALGICTGLVCLVIPWGRISPVGLQVAIVAATAEVAAWVALAGPSYGVYYVVVAAYAGYVSRRRGEVAGHAALILVALLVPLLYESDPGAVAGNALLIMPAAATLSAMAAWVRGHVTSRQRLYRQFAVEALRLAVRIRGDALAPQPLEPLPRDGSAEAVGSAAEVGSGREAFEQLATELETLSGQGSPARAGSPRRRQR
jgi:hypothetical protein